MTAATELTYPELLDAFVRSAAIDNLTEDDTVWLTELNQVKRRYEEHALGWALTCWHDVACEMESNAGWLELRGEYTGVQFRKAKSYHQAAESIRLEIVTGKPHCTVCLGAHVNHECPTRPGAKR